MKVDRSLRSMGSMKNVSESMAVLMSGNIVPKYSTILH